jgi:hypothetical protein
MVLIQLKKPENQKMLFEVDFSFNVEIHSNIKIKRDCYFILRYFVEYLMHIFTWFLSTNDCNLG